ncbi:uncharacterized protein LOC143143580 [Ptiloglossa arizonensis]|uniref:uncharacterized protein LOC143143580 n=1 Tax=Ptiloglossa arizonensis TaxID=3350558 RepID=UPI003F9EF9F9
MMDDNTRLEKNHEESKIVANQKDYPNERINSISHSTSQQNRRMHFHSDSRSRSPTNTKSTNKWISSNAFINFVQDFRQNMTGIRSTRIFQLAGEAWRQMSLEEKQPYLNAAKTIKNQKEKQHKNEHVTKSTTNTEIKKNKIAKKQTRSSKEIKRPNKEPKQSRKKRNNTESDSNTATSISSSTITTDDRSDTN